MRQLLPVAVAILAAVVFIMLTEGGRQARQAVPVAVYLDKVLSKLGLGLSEVTVEGQRMTQDREIYAKLQLDKQQSIWLLDTAAARERVETLPWVLKASLKRVFPDRLHIEIRERVPTAIWNDGLETLLLDAEGRVLGRPSTERSSPLPIVFGAGASSHVSKIFNIVERNPMLKRKVGLFEWRANRRWTLHLKSGQQVHLPSNGVGAALAQLTKGRQGQRLLDTNFEMLDLRLKDEIAVKFRK
ncbi:MAG: FtsQ-type POTRA domain-containing protein [Hyphomicrobiaceae bacterium]